MNNNQMEIKHRLRMRRAIDPNDKKQPADLLETEARILGLIQKGKTARLLASRPNTPASEYMIRASFIRYLIEGKYGLNIRTLGFHFAGLWISGTLKP